MRMTVWTSNSHHFTPVIFVSLKPYLAFFFKISNIRLSCACVFCPSSYPRSLCIQDLVERGHNLPLLIRFSGILEDRIRLLHEAFSKAIAEAAYDNAYRGVFPVKVCQQKHVIEEVRYRARVSAVATRAHHANVYRHRVKVYRHRVAI
jgi:hypothetical protein